MGSCEADREFSLRYQINISKMISSYDNNSKELSGLKSFVDNLMTDCQKTVSKINITGYSSPDGVTVNNLRLAKARAQDLRQYINREYGMSKYGGETKGVVHKWSDARSLVQRSSIPQKSDVIKIISNTTLSEAAIESRLKAIPSAWSYMVKYILPKMRLVEIEVVYLDSCTKPTSTQTTPRVVEEVVENNYIFIFNESGSDASIIENTYAVPVDYEIETRRKYVFTENRRREKVKGYFIDSSGRERGMVKYK